MYLSNRMILAVPQEQRVADVEADVVEVEVAVGVGGDDAAVGQAHVQSGGAREGHHPAGAPVSGVAIE